MLSLVPYSISCTDQSWYRMWGGYRRTWTPGGKDHGALSWRLATTFREHWLEIDQIESIPGGCPRVPQHVCMYAMKSHFPGIVTIAPFCRGSIRSYDLRNTLWKTQKRKSKHSFLCLCIVGHFQYNIFSPHFTFRNLKSSGDINPHTYSHFLGSLVYSFCYRTCWTPIHSSRTREKTTISRESSLHLSQKEFIFFLCFVVFYIVISFGGHPLFTLSCVIYSSLCLVLPPLPGI